MSSLLEEFLWLNPLIRKKNGNTLNGLMWIQKGINIFGMQMKIILQIWIVYVES